MHIISVCMYAYKLLLTIYPCQITSGKVFIDENINDCSLKKLFSVQNFLQSTIRVIYIVSATAWTKYMVLQFRKYIFLILGLTGRQRLAGKKPWLFRRVRILKTMIVHKGRILAGRKPWLFIRFGYLKCLIFYTASRNLQNEHAIEMKLCFVLNLPEFDWVYTFPIDLEPDL